VPASGPNFEHAVAFLQRGALDEAEACCRSVLRADQRHFNALHVLGIVALQRGRADNAVEFIGKSIQINPHQPAAYLNMSNALLMTGNPDGALESTNRALALRPQYAEALNNRGTALLDLKRPAEALDSYERALQLQPSAAVLHTNRGNALRDLRRHQEALSSYEHALHLQPGMQEAIIGRAEALRSLHRYSESLETVDAYLRINPEHGAALHLAGALLLDLDRTQESLQYLDRALQKQPDVAAVWVNRGNAYFKLQHLEQALQSYEQALEVAPNDADAAYNRGNALLGLQRFEEALTSYDRALAVQPDFIKAHYYRGRVLRKLKRPREALESFTRALQLAPDYAEAASGSGDALHDLGQSTDALASYERALQLNPVCSEALKHLGHLLMHLNRPEEAIGYLERLCQTTPDDAPENEYALGMLLHARLLCCDWRDYEKTSAAVIAGVQAGKRITLPSLFLATSDSAEAQLKCAQIFVAETPTMARACPWTGAPYRHDRIRLAYVSADFREHPVSYLIGGLIEAHDRQRFEVIAISLRPPQDSPIGRRVQAAFDQFIDVSERSDSEVAALMRELEIDIAVDLTGNTDGSRPGVFAQRPAPIQVNYLGYAGTMASPHFDYLLADRVIIPEADQPFYTERIVYLPHSYQPNDSKRAIAERTPTREECGLPDQGFVFCCFNAHYKIAPPMFDIWMRLLKSIKGSVLWLPQGRESVAVNLRREASARGVEPQRIVFAPRVAAMEDHLARYRVADLFLDTLPFNAHTTASDALWAGLPVLTCQGRSFVSRVASSLLTAVGLPKLIAPNLKDYEALALRLAQTPSELAELRNRLAQQRNVSPLFDTVLFRRDIESTYLRM
jgi:predicted O-linked N-acetylglucosamine transferase (SPINDLY family)